MASSSNTVCICVPRAGIPLTHELKVAEKSQRQRAHWTITGQLWANSAHFGRARSVTANMCKNKWIKEKEQVDYLI